MPRFARDAGLLRALTPRPRHGKSNFQQRLRPQGAFLQTDQLNSTETGVKDIHTALRSSLALVAFNPFPTLFQHLTAPPATMSPPHPDLLLLQRMLKLVESPKELKVQYSEPIFVCIDCEAFEHAQSKITEVGLAVLDANDIAGVNPGVDCQEWFKKIKHAHLRPIQYGHLRNKAFIKGCPDSFGFGSTVWVDLAEAKEILRRIFRDPTKLHQSWDASVHIGSASRNVVFVAHGAGSDDVYLQKLGFSLKAHGNIVKTIDTQKMVSSKKNQVGLSRLLHSLGNIRPVNLHNAGNDAAYTLQAMLTLAVREQQEPGSALVSLSKIQGNPVHVRNSVVAPVIWTSAASAYRNGSRPPAGQMRRGGSRLSTSDRKRRARQAENKTAAEMANKKSSPPLAPKPS